MAIPAMNSDLPHELVDYLIRMDRFISTEIEPLQHSNDNDRFFDHRREHARTNWEAGGLPL